MYMEIPNLLLGLKKLFLHKASANKGFKQTHYLFI